MNANELIAKAYYLSDVVSRELETVSGSQQADGLDMLNDLLAEKSAKGYRIPYYTHSTFNMVAGQEEYFIPDLIEVDAITYNIGDIRYSVRQVNRRFYFGSPRADSVESLPASYHFERSLGGGKFYFYNFPNDSYQANITGKFALTEVAGCDDLSLGLDRYYIAYLKYALASRICDFYNIEFAPHKAKSLFEREKDIFEVSPPDMQLKKVSILSGRKYSTNWAYANLGRGYFP